MAGDGTEPPASPPPNNWWESAPNKVEKGTLEEFLPEGVLRQYGSDYLNKLPNVQEHPLTPESFFQKSDNTWSEYAVAYLLVYPYVVLIFLALGIGGYYLMLNIKRRQERKRMHLCPKCANPVFACALFCPVCGTANAAPMTLDLLGFGRHSRPAQLRTHPDLLRSYRRCHRCATSLPKAEIRQECPACHASAFSGIRPMGRFDHFVQGRFWRVFAILTVVGFVPVIGSLLAVSLYRRRLIDPYGLYLSKAKEGVSMGILALMRFLFRFLPFIGIIGVPLLAVTENYIYRRAFLLGGKPVKEKESHSLKDI